MADGILLTGEVLRQKWRKFVDLVGMLDDEQLNLSEGWLSQYKARAGLKQIKCHGEAASATSEAVDKEQQRMQEVIKKHDRGLSDKQQSGVKGQKKRLTYLFVANADGSTKLLPLIIGKAYKPCPFGNKTGKQLGFNYRNNAKTWMTATLYQEWLLDWDRTLRDERRNILLLQDNFLGHVVPNSLTNIEVENFEPNLTAHVQPNDQGIIHCFKAHYHAQFISHTIDHYNTDVTPSKIYNIDQLEAMRLAQDAWNRFYYRVDTTTIWNCWTKAGILPDSPPSRAQPTVPISSLVHTPDIVINPIAHSETLVENALDKLEATGALQRSNRMAVAELLNPAFESHNIFNATDEEICKSVMDAKILRETGNDDGDDGDIFAPGPTRNEALQAALVLRNFTITFTTLI
ncbi:hypothetical protein SERLADRAFT_452720 [Serpula lacrymans var. lacrymans S7.9]|uniref:HTH CENPB-type domain-containing protein n=1 Tax=Serpula lacrymans var. lacrymans (strain S7.9) TaxID=578457 RepID=F8P872_SERL9|nr:uncharacterized protein SERLADRAFT_452720 [Serpula lacrymans var. lacrymans S7.9]EGO20629.1 hypothetical protein SERLADRAFT_452720 [Serpula lacrymans var. lacrymans S7.9]